jgi:hypothetical protein
MRAADGLPVMLRSGGQVPIGLSRLRPDDPSLAESEIQSLVLAHPSVLPVQELDPAFGPLIPIGREIGTPVGAIDALFVSPGGVLTIVEAKLWRNPQARREVVGQIIDYATALSTWTYEDLDNVCYSATRKSLWKLVSSQADGQLLPTEADFVDAVSRGLRTGRFLLLVVGDGIREEVERMTAYVQTAPRLQFHIALVELRIYEAADRDLRLVVPSVVARTAEVTRAVVSVNVAEQASVEVDVSVPSDDSTGARRKLTMEQFCAELGEQVPPPIVAFTRDVLEGYAQDPRFLLVPRAASFSLQQLNPTGTGHFTVLVFETRGQAYPGWLQGHCERAGIPGDVALRFVADLAGALGIGVNSRFPDRLARPASLELLADRWDAVAERLDQLARVSGLAVGGAV